jgi:hypothetical protein
MFLEQIPTFKKQILSIAVVLARLTIIILKAQLKMPIHYLLEQNWTGLRELLVTTENANLSSASTKLDRVERTSCYNRQDVGSVVKIKAT